MVIENMFGSHQYDKKLGMGGCADKKYCFLLYQMEKIDTLSIANFIKDIILQLDFDCKVSAMMVVLR